MAGYYIYLISSLPMLHFGAKPPFTMGKFLSACAELIDPGDLEILKGSLDDDLSEDRDAPPVIKRWRDFSIALKNELVKIRSARRHIDASRFLRRDGYADQWISHIAIGAYRNQSILEGERTLDGERWKFLDELSIGHYFDIELLMIYARKLSILERWDRVRTADAKKLLEEAFIA